MHYNSIYLCTARPDGPHRPDDKRPYAERKCGVFPWWRGGCLIDRKLGLAHLRPVVCSVVSPLEAQYVRFD